MEKKLYFVLYENLGDRDMNEISDTEWEELSDYSYTIEEYAEQFNDDYTYWQFPDRENCVVRVM